jgi:SAM dependent carboxyl methyltransferase
MFDALFPQGIWCVDFEYALPDGRPAPHCVVAREMRTGRLIRKWKPLGDGPPYPVGSDALFVCYSAQAEISCHIALGWPIPARVLDLCAEYSDITSGLRPNTEWRALINAMERFGLAHAAPAEKKAMQDRALQGDPWADQEIIEMLDYCQTDVDALRHLLPAMLPQINIHRAVYRGMERFVFESQAAQDWETFLSLRAKELRPGGRLVVVVPGAGEDGVSGFENIMDHANAVLVEMVEDGAITADEYERMVLGVWPRRSQDLRVPFASDGRFHDLIVESCETTPLSDAAWADYQRDGNLADLVNKHATYYRATFAPSLASALRLAHKPETCRAFSESLEHKLRQRLVREPTPINSLVETIVLAKQDVRR